MKILTLYACYIENLIYPVAYFLAQLCTKMTCIEYKDRAISLFSVNLFQLAIVVIKIMKEIKTRQA